MRLTLLAFAGLFLLATSCTDGSIELAPKPRAFPKVTYPVPNYVTFDEGTCPFKFTYPDYMEIRQDKSFFEEAPPHACWFDLHMPGFNADVHWTYTPIQHSTSFQMMVQDAFHLANEQNKRASFIEDYQIKLPGNVSGMAFSLEGPSASPFQFFLTDSTQHFVRGSLYFNTKPNPDSLGPIVDYVRKDILKIIESLTWKE